MSRCNEYLPATDGVTCQNQGDCGNTDYSEDRHHLYWPRSAYRTAVEKRFRELAVNKIVICRLAHNEHHATTAPPEKPTREQMLVAIDKLNEGR